MTKRKILVVVLVFLALAVSKVQAEMYIGGYFGRVWVPNVVHELTVNHPSAGAGFPSGSGEILETDDDLEAVFHGGLKLGAWFEQKGVLSGISFPSWMKYLGFYIDCSYHRVHNTQSWRRSVSTYRNGMPPQVFILGKTPRQCSGRNPEVDNDGSAFTLAFTFALRYGFFPTEKVPFGRLQPYIAVGPAIVFSHQDLDITVCRVTAGRPGQPKSVKYVVDPDGQNSVDIALAVETGARWMVRKNVSVELTFKWRHVKPHYQFEAFNGFSVWAGVPTRFTFDHNPTFNFISVQAGSAYHF